MKKRVLTTMNVLLGAASLALLGCHSQKAVSQQPERAARDGKVVAMYGVPTWRADSIPSQIDSIPQAQPDTTVQQTPPRPAGGKVLVKYGVPPTRM
ncbi:MAG: hypothetical protein IK073_07855 [Paludibacteraceae bacterium]|nr:hypothetical protein [Paludibacteraceae bacterium]